jgi:hypothetical protein
MVVRELLGDEGERRKEKPRRIEGGLNTAKA